MQITEITASFSRTIQIEPYHPVSFHASAKATVEDGESLKAAYDELFKTVRLEVWDRCTQMKNGIRTADSLPIYTQEDFDQLTQSGKLDGKGYTGGVVVKKLRTKYTVDDKWIKKFDNYLNSLTN